MEKVFLWKKQILDFLIHNVTVVKVMRDFMPSVDIK
jgi:hypothetical protein